MITKEKALEALETLDESCIYTGPAKTLRQYIEETADLRRQLDRMTSISKENFDKLNEWQAECISAESQLAEAQAEKNRLVRDLDVLWNGEEGAAKQASLCDMVAQISKELPSLREAQARLAELDGQEPVEYQFQCEDGTWHGFIDERHYINTVEDGSWPIRALYTNPAPSPADQKDAARWINPNDKTQKQYLPHIGEPVLFTHGGRVFFGSHTGGSFTTGSGICQQHFPTWDCQWMPLPAAPDAAMLAASPGGQDTKPDSPAHRAAKVLMDAIVYFIDYPAIACQNDFKISREALATAKQIMDEAEATK